MRLEETERTIATRAWAWWMLGSTVVLCAVVAAFNALVDPTAQLGTGALEPVAAGPRDRVAKAALLEARRDADLVVLGSSRTKKLDPARLGAARGVNAAVVGGDLFEARVLAAWLAKRTAAANGRMPQLVVGVDVEQFRDSSLQGSGFLDVPELAAVARSEAAGSSGSLRDELDRLERLLLSWQVTKASLVSVRARRTTPARSEGRDERTQRASEFTGAGVPTSDERWFSPDARRLAARTPASIARVIDEYGATYEQSLDRPLDADAVADLRALVALVRATGGPPPLLYVTPAHPRFIAALEEDGRGSRRARVLRELHRLKRSGDAVVVDCSSCIDAADTSWIDATHPSPLGTRQLARRLRQELASRHGR